MWMCGHTRRDKLRYEDIRREMGADLVVDKRWEMSLRWLGHVKRNTNVPVRRCVRLTVIGQKRGRGRPMKNWRGVIRYDP